MNDYYHPVGRVLNPDDGELAFTDDGRMYAKRPIRYLTGWCVTDAYGNTVVECRNREEAMLESARLNREAS